MTVAELIELLQQQVQDLEVGIPRPYTFRKKNGQLPDYFMGRIHEFGSFRGILVLNPGDQIQDFDNFDIDEIEGIKPKDCYCDEDQGAGYTYSDEFGDCDACLNYYRR